MARASAKREGAGPFTGNSHVMHWHIRVAHPVIAYLRGHLSANVALNAIAVSVVVQVAHPAAWRQDLKRIREARSRCLLHLRNQSAVHVAIDSQIEMDLAIEVIAVGVGIEALDPDDAGVEAQLDSGHDAEIPLAGDGLELSRLVSRSRRLRGFPVLAELLDAGIGQRMVDHLT
jgi:hypothetical protein